MDVPPGNPSLWRSWASLPMLGGFAIAALAIFAYSNSLRAPFVLDDAAAITENRSIENLRNLGAVFAPDPEVPTAGRPLLNLSFALNYAAGGRGVVGYHVTNLVLHVCAALLLFGVVRRTLRIRSVDSSRRADAIALAVALLWVVHPVHTASVTYVSQRAEVLMGCFFLLTLYALSRDREGQGWRWLAVAAGGAGMMTKETMVVAPVIALLYDRIFLAASFREVLRRRGGFHAAMAATWVILAALMAGTHVTTRGIGYSETVNAWTYALTESRVVLSYLQLTAWPFPLVFDYGPEIALTSLAQAWPYVAALLVVLAGVALLVRRAPAAGFAALGFLLTLAPTSSIVPVTHQPMAENRLYLPAAAVLALVVGGASRIRLRAAVPVVTLLALAFAMLTVRRNRDYRDARTLWADTVAKQPLNVRARSHLGETLREAGDFRAATVEFEAALRLNPDYPAVLNNLGLILSANEAMRPEAVRHFEHALRLDPTSAYLHNNIAAVLMQTPGHESEAIAHLEESIRLKPDYPDSHRNLGTVLIRIPGRGSDAVREYAEAARLEPQNAGAHVNLGFGLAVTGHPAEAIKQFEIALRLNPNHAQAHAQLGNVLLQASGGLGAAIGHYRQAVALDPNAAEAWANLGVALSRTPGGHDEAMAALQRALQLRPNLAAAQKALDRIREER